MVLRERAIYGQNAFYNINLYWSNAFGCVVEGEMFMTGWTDWCWDNSSTITNKLKFQEFSKRRIEILFA